MIKFIPWARIRVNYETKAVRSFFAAVANEGKRTFLAGIDGKHSGRIAYRRGGGRFTRSAPGEYPARDSGDLRASVDSIFTSRSATVGSNVAYSIFLREGTTRMERRRMSDTALMTAAENSREKLGRFVKWERA